MKLWDIKAVLVSSRPIVFFDLLWKSVMLIGVLAQKVSSTNVLPLSLREWRMGEAKKNKANCD